MLRALVPLKSYIRERRYWRRLERNALKLLHASADAGAIVREGRSRGYELETVPFLPFLMRADELESDFALWISEESHKGITPLASGLQGYVKRRRARW